MFRGITDLNLDAKGRVAIPARHRARLTVGTDGGPGGCVIVTLHPLDPCLLVYPVPEWERIETAVTQQPNMDRQVLMLQRRLIGHAEECELDGQGRILLSASLRKRAGLDKRVVLVGQGNKFELWDEQRWTSELDKWADEDNGGGLSAALQSLSL
ncbi:MAG: division/cell wall cluster transcriptional repressor MraZ [Chromatiales bacterium]|nr:division/cell wall cluster transcriptional repressor MraZ [Chromatiales bacterium]MDX9767222.1 division/cell wall cluster transcriptional repressor MraZ [Ectothiorhodospiraceae bacterium]